MPLQIPTLAETRGLARDFLAARLAGYGAAPANNRARVLSDGTAALAFGAYLYIAELASQFLPDTATGEWLDRWADIFGVPREAATYAVGSVSVTGSFGTILPAGSQFAANGIAYESVAAVTVGLAPTPVDVRALTPGVVGNMDPGAAVSISVAVAGVNASAVAIAVTGGVDTEDDDSLRDRVLARIRTPPMGGDADDYVAWAREVPGVTRAWCSPNEMGPGTVTVRFMMDDLRATDDPLTDGFPTPDDVAVVQAHIAGLRPVTADLFVTAPVPEPIGFSLGSLVRDTPSTRAALAASVAAMIRDRAAPARAVFGVTSPAQTIHREWVSSAILDAAGVETFDLTMLDHLMPTRGSIGVLGTISYV